MKARLALAAALLLPASQAPAQRAQSPADATVFIRLVGSVHAEVEDVGFTRSVEVENVEIGTGSGFVISPYGYVLTNEHVVSDGDQFLVTMGLQRATVTLNVSRIDVCFRPEAVAAHGLASPCAAASVAASDPTRDLAVLLVSGANLPYLAFGDSDAVMAGLPVDAFGYPFGREVEIEKVATASDFVPEVSTTPGAISALRADDAGERRHLQVTNSLNPGSSGGPIVDRDGFAVGVIRTRLTNATGIGFAIPINEAKDLLEAYGLDQLMPARALRLGGFQSIEAKGVGLRLLEGLADMSPFRSRVETHAWPVDIALRIDRVLSPWDPRQIEQTLIGTPTFETFQMSAREGRASRQAADRSLLLGRAAGRATDTSQETWMDYAVLDLGPEKLVARYVGPAEWMAFNESVFRESLTSLVARRLVVREPGPVEELEWSTPSLAAIDQVALPVPAGWRVAPSGPSPCRGLPRPNTLIAASPPDDFSFVARAAVWPAGEVVPDAAASACASRRGSLGDASYTSRADWLGVSYVVEGVFALVGQNEVVQLEVLSTEEAGVFARALLAVWLKKATE